MKHQVRIKMEPDVDPDNRRVCCTCLSSGRNLQSLNTELQIYQTFSMLMNDITVDRFGYSEMVQLVCWECVALLKKVMHFKQKAQSAQAHLRALTLNHQTVDHTSSHSLSSLKSTTKADFDTIYFEYSVGNIESNEQSTKEAIVTNVKIESIEEDNVNDNISLDSEEAFMEVPIVDNPAMCVMSYMSDTDPLETTPVKTEAVNIGNIPSSSYEVNNVIPNSAASSQMTHKDDEQYPYFIEMMNDEELMVYREECRNKQEYVSAHYKCENCIVAFAQKSQLKDHLVSEHKPVVGKTCCPVCSCYILVCSLKDHVQSHFWRYACKLCSRKEHGLAQIAIHMNSHIQKSTEGQPVRFKCRQCDATFRTSKARWNHTFRRHNGSVQCDLCKKIYANKYNLIKHLKTHEGPSPQTPCPICQKLVVTERMKYHIQRHENTKKYICVECDKEFSHIDSYRWHFKNAKAHAPDKPTRFPCTICDKGYPTNEELQDHIDFSHLGKTQHKCPICDKPLASRKMIKRHIKYMHDPHKTQKRKKEGRDHVCDKCGKGFKHQYQVSKHMATHSGDRPLSCDLCLSRFKHQSSLYLHRKNVHKIVSQKKNIEFTPKPETASK